MLSAGCRALLHGRNQHAPFTYVFTLLELLGFLSLTTGRQLTDSEIQEADSGGYVKSLIQSPAF